MENKNSTNKTIWLEFVKNFKIISQIILKFFDDFNNKFPSTMQFIQLSFMYYFAFLDLCFSIANPIFALGFDPEILGPLNSIVRGILLNPFLRVWTSPEKLFLFSFGAIEFMVVRKTFKFSKLIRYNILLLFTVLMIQGTMVSYWDLIFNRQIVSAVADWAYDEGFILFLDTNLAFFFFLATFVLFLIAYIYFYLTAIQGKFVTIPGMSWLTDSVAFWLKIKTPTMGIGDRGKKKKK